MSSEGKLAAREFLMAEATDEGFISTFSRRKLVTISAAAADAGRLMSRRSPPSSCKDDCNVSFRDGGVGSAMLRFELPLSEDSADNSCFNLTYLSRAALKSACIDE